MLIYSNYANHQQIQHNWTAISQEKNQHEKAT